MTQRRETPEPEGTSYSGTRYEQPAHHDPAQRRETPEARADAAFADLMTHSEPNEYESDAPTPSLKYPALRNPTSASVIARQTDSAWMVIRQRETDPPEVWKFSDEGEARAFHDKAQMQWSDCFLTCVVKQGAQLDASASVIAEMPHDQQKQLFDLLRVFEPSVSSRIPKVGEVVEKIRHLMKRAEFAEAELDKAETMRASVIAELPRTLLERAAQHVGSVVAVQPEDSSDEDWLAAIAGSHAAFAQVELASVIAETQSLHDVMRAYTPESLECGWCCIVPKQQMEDWADALSGLLSRLQGAEK